MLLVNARKAPNALHTLVGLLRKEKRPSSRPKTETVWTGWRRCLYVVSSTSSGRRRRKPDVRTNSNGKTAQQTDDWQQNDDVFRQLQRLWCSAARYRTRASKRGTPPLEIVILPLLAHLARKRLHVDTDLLRIITCTADELSSGTNIDDLEWPWTPKIGVFSEFLSILGCNTHFKSELRQNHSR